jgi:hypothetical protein
METLKLGGFSNLIGWTVFIILLSVFLISAVRKINARKNVVRLVRAQRAHHSDHRSYRHTR